MSDYNFEDFGRDLVKYAGAAEFGLIQYLYNQNTTQATAAMEGFVEWYDEYNPTRQQRKLKSKQSGIITGSNPITIIGSKPIKKQKPKKLKKIVLSPNDSLLKLWS